MCDWLGKEGGVDGMGLILCLQLWDIELDPVMSKRLQLGYMYLLQAGIKEVS